MVERAGGGGGARINARQRAAVGLVGALWRVVGGMRRQVIQFRCGPDQQAGERQLATEFVNFIEIVIERGRRLQAQRFAQDIRGDEGVAVAVAANPGADAEERRQCPGPRGITGVQLPRDLDIEARKFAEEGFLEVGNTIFDLVQHLEAHRAQHARLPQGEDGVGETAVVLHLLLGCHSQALALVEQVGEVAVVADQALALNLGRVRGEDRRDERVHEEVGDGLGCDFALGQAVEGMDEAAFARRRTGQIVRPAAPDVVLVLGDVGQLQEVAESTDDDLCRAARERIEEGSELGVCRRATVAGETHGGLTDALDNLEGFSAFLLAHGVTEDTAEKPDVGPQRLLLVTVGHGERHQCLRTRRTEASDSLETCSATEPRRSSARPRWPWRPMTIRSQPSSRALATRTSDTRRFIVSRRMVSASTPAALAVARATSSILAPASRIALIA